MAKIIVESELMKNNKQAVIMSAENSFEALETADGTPVFFSIGSDHIFYVTTQVSGHDSGWSKQDISSVLSEFHDGKLVLAKKFMVSRNRTHHLIDIALAVTVENEDFLYVVLDQKNDIESWTKQIKWVFMKFDAEKDFTSMKIEQTYIAQAHSGEYIVADILKQKDGSPGFLHRYYIDPTKNISGKFWNEHDLPVNLLGSKLSSAIGKKSKQPVDGIYTLGTIQNKPELLYTPLYNYFNPVIPPNSSRLDIPKDTTAIAVMPTAEGNTGLFVTAGSSLLYFPPDHQNDGDAGTIIAGNELFEDVKFLRAYASPTSLVVWGLNEEGFLFYTRSGPDADPLGNWSVPIPILNNVEEVACYLDEAGDSSVSVLFALLDGQNLVQLTQDADTTAWHQRNILLPGTEITDVLEFSTYTSHVRLTGDDNIPLTDQTVILSSTSPVSVYVNNEFRILSPGYPIEVPTGPTGTFTVLQETNSVGAVCYHMQIKDYDSPIDVNPMNKLLEVMAGVTTGEQLGNIQVTNANGTVQKLVPADITTDQKDAAAASMKKFVEISKTLPQDGSVQQLLRPATIAGSAFMAGRSSFWGVSFTGDQWRFFEGERGMAGFGLTADPVSGKILLQRPDFRVDDLLGSSISATAGDIYNWLKYKFKEVTDFFVELIEDVFHFFVKIGGIIYNFVLNCINDIVQGVEFVFSKISVFFEDLIKWLGFLFNWDDILRSHKVLKNTLKLFLYKTVDDIEVIKEKIGLVFENIDNRVKEWADIENVANSISGESSNSSGVPGQHSPQANYGVSHLNQGISSSSTGMTQQPTWTQELEDLIAILQEAINKEEGIFQSAYQTLKDEIIDVMDTLSLGELIKRLIGIILSLLIESTENMIETALTILQQLVKDVISFLDAPIDIPVISWLYHKISGEDLSILDAACLVCAIPGTIVCKLITENVPFPDDELTAKLINANSWDELAKILHSSGTRPGNTLAPAAGLDGPISIFTLFMHVIAGFSSMVFVWLSILKTKTPASKSVSVTHGIFFFATTAPNFISSLVTSAKQEWYVIVNEVVYSLTTLQKIADIFSYNTAFDGWKAASKVIDCILGVAGLVPTFAVPAYNPTARTITGSLGNATWNINRILTPFADLNGSLPQKIAYGAKMGGILAYGVTQFIIIIEPSEVGSKPTHSMNYKMA